MNISNVQGQDWYKIISGNSDNKLIPFGSEMSGGAGEIDFSKVPEIPNRDKFVLNLPASETIYKRQEFSADEGMAEGCAYCYTYMERVLDLGSGISFISTSNDGYFIINADKEQRTFGKSGANMNDIAHAVEETWERIERSLEQTTVSGSLSGSVTENGHTVGGSLDFSMQSTVYRYLSVSETKGSVAYKNGAISVYREKAISFREVYNRCAMFLAEAFGEKSADMFLDEKKFSEFFGKPDNDEKNSPKDPEQKHSASETQLGKLREFMEKKLSDVRKKDPDCRSLKIFADTYSKLKAYDFTDIASLVEKMLSAEQ